MRCRTLDALPVAQQGPAIGFPVRDRRAGGLAGDMFNTHTPYPQRCIVPFFTVASQPAASQAVPETGTSLD